MYYLFLVVFFFKLKTAYEMRISDWSSDVCSSDLMRGLEHRLAGAGVVGVGAARLEVDRRQLPALEGVFQAFGEALFLLLLVGAQPVLEQHDAVVDEQLLERGRLLQARLDLGVDRKSTRLNSSH